ncbi:CSEP0449 effector protein [Echinococcus multilocularis]|uniref:CSEP0449 effector protein n=1 Tax=Echinococcus multilocularis TaxID=6211 RepID=A0A0S4MM81_ECHMU|nr:CSEP0449 effector protein [Echinococcus multilocularis]
MNPISKNSVTERVYMLRIRESATTPSRRFDSCNLCVLLDTPQSLQAHKTRICIQSKEPVEPKVHEWYNNHGQP